MIKKVNPWFKIRDSDHMASKRIITIKPNNGTTLLGRGSFGQVILCPEGACKQFLSTEIFFHESAMSIYLTGLPGIVEVKEVNCVQKKIVMKSYQENLDEWMRNNPYRPENPRTMNRTKFILYILIGLHSIHQLGLLHGDLKPQNILIENEKAVLIDFGNTGSPLYITLAFMTPFYAPRDLETTSSADIYALGIIILEMWKPFKSYETPPINFDLQNSIRVSPLPQQLKRIALACTSKFPKDRPTAKEIYSDLTKVKLSCYLPEITTQPNINAVNADDLCEIWMEMRKKARIFRLKSPERTIGLLNYWAGTRQIRSEEYSNYATAILYLYDQISNPSQSKNIEAYAGKEQFKQDLIKQYVCQLLSGKRGLQILIQGY